jgi:hypothetical protein
LVVAALIDAALVTGYEVSPAMRVSRAVLRTIRDGACEEAVVVRGKSVDKLFVVDSWLRNDRLVSVPIGVDFAPGAGLTHQSLQMIREGADVDLSGLTAALPAKKQDLGIQPLLNIYRSQVGAADSWLQGPCFPFANPFQSNLRAVGGVTAQGVDYRVFRGNVRYARGAFQLFFPNAEVWFGVRPGGRLGFELLVQLPSKDFNPAISVVATLFRYPSTHTGRAFAAQAPAVRAAFYAGVYAQVLATIRKFEAHRAASPA